MAICVHVYVAGNLDVVGWDFPFLLKKLVDHLDFDQSIIKNKIFIEIYSSLRVLKF
jgi:hypothetical protein